MNRMTTIRVGSACLSHATQWGFTLLLAIPPSAGYSQCPAPPPPQAQTPQVKLKQVAIPPPEERVCCIFYHAIALEPTNMGGHVYGNGGDVAAASGKTKEPVGYVYTAAAGLVDIGHVRDNADMVLWVYAHLMNGDHNFRVGNDTVFVGAIPSGKDPQLALAGAIVYVNSWAHELATWGDTPTSILNEIYGGSPDTPAEDFSAFSPEDMSSNIVGIVAATKAIDAGNDASVQKFDEQMDAALASMMINKDDPFYLSGQPMNETQTLLTQVEYKPGDKADLAGKWWSFDSTSMPNMFIRLLRRNFDGKPWKIAGAPAIDTPAWMDTKRFSSLYNHFLYYMSSKLVVDATQVPETTILALGPPALLRWTPIPMRSIPETARLGEALGGGSCLLDKTSGKALSYSQYGIVLVNVDQVQGENIIAKMQDATDAISATFVKANSCLQAQPCTLPEGAKDAGLMDGP